MSVLFKALEKAARQNAEAQGPDVAAGSVHGGASDAAAMAGGAGRRGGRTVIRVAGIAFIAVTAAILAGLVIMGDDVERLLAEAMQPAPMVTPPSPPAPAQPQEPPQIVANVDTVSSPPAEAVAVAEPAPVDMTAAPTAVPEGATGDAATDPGLPLERSPVSVQGETAAADPEDDIALLMKEGASRRAAAPVEPAVPAVAPATPGPETVRPERVSVEDALAARQGSADRSALTAPVTVGRDGAGSLAAAVTVSTLSRDTQASLAEAYNDLVRGNFGAALAGYTAIAEHEPANVAALAGQAAALHKLRRLAEAQAAYEKVLALQPDNRQALSNMISLIGDSAPRDAIRRLEALQSQAPDFSPVPAQLGMLYARMGDIDRAAAALRRAITLSPENALYHYNLAVVNDRAGRRADAVRAYEQVLGLIRSGAAGGIAAQPIADRVAYLRARP